MLPFYEYYTLNTPLNMPSNNRTMPSIITMIPATLLIHSNCLTLNVLLQRLKSQEKKNQYTAEPAATARRTGATLKLCGITLTWKKANNAKMTKMAPGLERPNATACKKSFIETDETSSGALIRLKGSRKAIEQPNKATTMPPTSKINSRWAVMNSWATAKAKMAITAKSVSTNVAPRPVINPVR